MANTIKLKSYLDIIEEHEAAASITPGYLLELTSAGKVQAHSAEGGSVAPAMFAFEDELQGNDIDEDYSSGDIVQCWIPTRGDKVQAILKDGENVDIGDYLESGGDGTLIKHVQDSGSGANVPQQIVAVAREALDLSDSSGAESSDSDLGYNRRIDVTIV